MKRFNLICLLLGSLAMVGCGTAKEPENETMTSWKGVDLPSEMCGREEMVALLELVESGREVDDEAFLAAMTAKVFDWEEQFEHDRNQTTWMSVACLAGGSPCGLAMMMADGNYNASHYLPTSTAAEYGMIGNAMRKEYGYEGWYTTHQWSYDAESNTIETTVGEDVYVATLLYFADNVAVFEGFLGNIAYTQSKSARILNNLYKVVFADGRDEYFDKYASYDEYYSLAQECAEELGFENFLD